MEHAQRVAMHIYFIKDVVLVLILILMEHAQRVMVSVVSDRKNDVLILILMEHAQRYKKNLGSKEEQNSCLNPYFNGTCSKIQFQVLKRLRLSRLNPYFNGTCSKMQTNRKSLSD